MDSVDFTSILKLIAVIGAVLAMLYGLNRVYARLSAKNQGFGPNSIRAIGIVLFLPILFMLALLTNFQTETLAALLGTVAGYVLSSSKPEE
jgi:hypothetical protein